MHAETAIAPQLPSFVSIVFPVSFPFILCHHFSLFTHLRPQHPQSDSPSDSCTRPLKYFLVSPGADFNGLRIGRHRPLNLLRPLSLPENSCVAQLVRSIRSFSSSDGCTAKPRRVALSGDPLPVFVIVRIVPGLQRGPAIVRLGSTD
jgi:hypothetical protein